MAVFTRQHYQEIATIILAEKQAQATKLNFQAVTALNDLAYRLIEYFESDNRRFSRTTFLHAIGGDNERG